MTPAKRYSRPLECGRGVCNGFCDRANYFHCERLAILLLDEETRNLPFAVILVSAEAERIRVPMGVGLTVPPRESSVRSTPGRPQGFRYVGTIPETVSELAIL